eukprot:TRINITY_DN3723_c0_g1_i1.p1 TRINITY_DN3723_c0_g1~~TRINITY_DN3723_c0_g1_i1.p1  ORF type:complete len:216 (-),score=48.84 TRINITY_DN3723_c0_g1_i1:51-629(-)
MDLLGMIHPSLPKEKAIIIKMVRIHQDVTEDDVRVFFSNITLVGVWLSKNHAFKLTGTGFIAVKTYEDAFKALSKTGGSIAVSVASESGKVITTTQVIGLYPSSKGEIMATFPSLFLGVRRNQFRSGHGYGRGGYRGRWRGRGGYRGHGGYRGRKRRDMQQQLQKKIGCRDGFYRTVKEIWRSSARFFLTVS